MELFDVCWHYDVTNVKGHLGALGANLKVASLEWFYTLHMDALSLEDKLDVLVEVNPKV